MTRLNLFQKLKPEVKSSLLANESKVRVFSTINNR